MPSCMDFAEFGKLFRDAFAADLIGVRGASVPFCKAGAVIGDKAERGQLGFRLGDT